MLMEIPEFEEVVSIDEKSGLFVLERITVSRITPWLPLILTKAIEEQGSEGKLILNPK